jgi:Pyocin activator protein PrtN
MNTAFLLMAQYEGKAVIPVEQVCQDYFSHLRVNKLIQKLTGSEIPIPSCEWKQARSALRGSIWWTRPSIWMNE